MSEAFHDKQWFHVPQFRCNAPAFQRFKGKLQICLSTAKKTNELPVGVLCDKSFVAGVIKLSNYFKESI